MARFASATLIAAILWVAAAATAAERFPVPANLEPNVRFWTRVYSEVDLSGGLIHDSWNLDVVYDVLRFQPDLSRRERDRQVKKAKRDTVIALKRLARGERNNLSAVQKRVLAAWPAGVTDATLAKAAKHVRFQLGQADRFKAGLARSGAWRSYVERVLQQAGLPLELVALPHVESSYRSNAYSSVGAAGMWQFTRGTGRLYMRVDNVVDERLDGYKASVAAAKLLKRNYEMLGAWPLAITAYNHGAGGMARAVRELGTDDIGKIVEQYKGRTFGFASRNFYAEFLAALEVDRNAERYFGPIHQDRPRKFDTVVLDAFYPPAALERAFGVDRETLKSFNPSLRPAVWNGNKYVPEGYALALPPRSQTLADTEVLASIPSSERKSEQHRDRYYKVRRGDSLSKIAQRYRIRERELVAANSLKSRHRIRVGQVLVLPDHAYRSPTDVARSAPPKDGIYRVRRGDNLSTIAARFGVSAKELAAANGLRNRNRVYVGQKLRVPGGDLPSVASSATAKSSVYKVRRGDNLSTIAKRHGVSTADIVTANRLKNRNSVYVGQKLRIPGGAATATAPRPDDGRYRVQRGDNLSTIAKRFGLDPNALAAANGLRNRNRLQVGQELRIPGGAAATASRPTPPDGIYRVQSGDNLSTIAKRFDVSESELVSENSLRNRNHVYVGQKLRIPGSVELAAAEPEAREAPEPTPAEAPAPAVDESDGPASIAAATPAVTPAGAAEPLAASTQTAATSVKTAAAAETASPNDAPAPDPSDYEVHADGSVTVQAAETLGHFAEWLEIKTSRLRHLNGLSFGAPVAIGRNTRLDFSRVTPETFEQRRLAYHHTLQEEYFTAFEVIGTKTHLLRKGESLWSLAEQKYRVPVWLIRQYNPDLDFGALQSGTRMVIPEVGPRGA